MPRVCTKGLVLNVSKPPQGVDCQQTKADPRDSLLYGMVLTIEEMTLENSAQRRMRQAPLNLSER